jgi:predicted small secreted protein
MKTLVIIAALILTGCNNMNKTGEATTAEGTTIDSRTNADMEDQRVGASADTLISPGSNSRDIRANGKGNLNGSNDNTTAPQPTQEPKK